MKLRQNSKDKDYNTLKLTEAYESLFFSPDFVSRQLLKIIADFAESNKCNLF